MSCKAEEYRDVDTRSTGSEAGDSDHSQQIGFAERSHGNVVGDVNTWREFQEDERPRGLVSLVSMAYGWIGVCTLTLFLLGPMGLALRVGWLKRGDKGPLKIGVLVSILIVVHGLDALGNSAFFLPIVSLIGVAVSGSEMRNRD